MKKAIIIIISLLVILGGTFAILWFFTPVFDFLKPASENFSLQVKKLFGEKEEVSYKDYIASIEKLKQKDSSYTADAKISMNVSLPSDFIDKDTQKILNSSSVEWKGSYDSNSKAASNNIALSFNKKEMINLNTIVDGKKISIASKDLYGKALTLDFNKFKEFCEKNNIDVSEENIKGVEDYFKTLENMQNSNNANFMYDLMYLTEDEYKAINKNYGDLLTTLIDKDKYTAKKNQKVSVGGEDVKVDGYTLTISGKDVYNYMKKLAEMAKDDANLKSILTKKINLVKDYIVTVNQLAESDVKSSKKSSPSDIIPSIESSEKAIKSSATDIIEDIKDSDIEEFFDNALDALEDSKEAFSSIEGVVKITIYTDKKSKNPIRVDIAIAKDEEDEGSVILSEEIEDGKKTYTIDIEKLAKEMGESSSSRGMPKIVIVDEYESTDTSKKGKVTVSAKMSGQKQEIVAIDYEKVNSDSEIKNNIKISSAALPSLSLDMKLEVTGLDKNKQEYVFDINASMPVQLSTYKFGISAEGSIEYGKSDIQKLDDSNSVDVFGKSKEEITAIVKEIVTNASETLPSKLSNYGVKVTKEDILKLIPAEQAQPTDTPVNTADGNTEIPEETQPAA